MADSGMDYDSNSRGYSETKVCNPICYNSGTFDSWSVSCRCTDTFYGQCCSNECLQIENCKRRFCYGTRDTKCLECFDDKIFFKRADFDTKCERMCAWNGHYCWPGECNEELKRGCSCAPGFTKIDTSSETSCQPALKPSILTCNTVVLILGGEKRGAMSKGGSTACTLLQDIYGNFKPSFLQFDITSEYTIDVSNYSKPNFIQESNFGVTDLAVNILRKDVNGIMKSLSTNKLLSDTSSSVEASQTINNSGNISLSSPIYDLHDGQALCFEYEVKGGGYLKSKNTAIHSISSTIPYSKVTVTREICYRFDNQPAQHCQDSGTCNEEPIQLQHRITRSPLQIVTFVGWTDPVPAGGVTVHASSIESYQITVNEVIPSKGRPSKVDTNVIFTKKVNHTENSMILNLTSDAPRLFSITLEVKDVANNVRQARRFILVDNSSNIGTRSDKPFRVTSASSQTNYTWQTHHHEVCLDWKDHFLNQFYLENELLNPIEPDPHGLIASVYEQLSGDLPVSGTPNKSCLRRTNVCYCPKVGACEMFNYIVPLDNLATNYKRRGDYNTSSYFTAKVTNNALLSSMAQEFVFNNSPPETDEYRVAVPVIVGGTIGGLTVVIAIVLTTFCIMRRKRTEKHSQQKGPERTAVGSTSVNIWKTLDVFRPSSILQKVIDLRSRNAHGPSECPEHQNEYEVFEEINLKHFKTKVGKLKSNVPQQRNDSEEATFINKERNECSRL